MMKQLERFNLGQDEASQTIQRQVVDVLEGSSSQKLFEIASRTTTSHDDRLVIEISEIERQVDALQANLKTQRQIHTKAISRVQELDSVRKNFQDARFDDVRSYFNDSQMVESAINQFLQGLVSSNQLWQQLRGFQAMRIDQQRVDYGSGSLGDILGDGSIYRGPGQGSRRSTWHIPTPRRGNAGIKIPRSASSGGFKTGGRF